MTGFDEQAGKAEAEAETGAEAGNKWQIQTKVCVCNRLGEFHK